MPALKLLTKFEIQGVKGQPRQVQDYAYTDKTAKQVLTWIDQQENPQNRNGLTVAQGPTDTELTAAIQRQTKDSRKRKAKIEKTTKKSSPTESEKTSEVTE